jgi:hypothetical protein
VNEDDMRYDATVPDPGEFAAYMNHKFGGVIVAPKGGFQVDDLRDAFLAGWEGAILDHDC